MKYIPTIGLEVHCELKTKSKLLCACANVHGGEPNANTCPVCTGQPGTLPKLNGEAVRLAVRAGLGVGSKISTFSKWDRKNYFYPDLPKAWQTSQFDLPLCVGGEVKYTLDGEQKSVRITRLHLEEDAGKLTHSGSVTMIDYNRCGVPLIECVTEPDMHSADEAVAFLEELSSIFRYLGISDCKMQEGSIRADVNLSLAREGEPLGVRTETKNLNSFRSVRRAIEAEIARQTEVLEGGGKIEQETRRFDENSGKGYTMRSKEDAEDYRYFPEPDLLPVVLKNDEIDEERAKLPELRKSRIDRYVRDGLSEMTANVLTAEPEISNLVDGATALGAKLTAVANYVTTEVMRKGKTEGEGGVTVGIKPSQLVDLLALVARGEINLVSSRDVLDEIWLTDESATNAVDKLGLRQTNDEGEIEKLALEIVEANPVPVADYKSGNQKVLSFFVGQLMKKTKGKVNPVTAGEVFKKILS